MKIESANGRVGVLIRTIDGKYMIRIYHEYKLSMFQDYDIGMNDLMFQIMDSAYLYDDGNGNLKIDYSPEVLGITVDK